MSAEIRQLSREEAAHVEVGQTTISRKLAISLVAVFLTTLVAVPAAQHVYELRRHQSGERESAWPQVYSMVESFRGASRTYAETKGSLTQKILATNAQLLKSINEYEDELEEESLLRDALLAPAQELMARVGAGNEQAYVGRDGWLFFRPGIDYVTGTPFLNQRTLAKRAAGGSDFVAPPQPDPRVAILQFRQQLDERGIQLIIMPTPVKPMIQPEKLSPRYDDYDEVIQNPSYEQFQSEMEEQGVLVFDVGAHLLERKRETQEPQFLETDTHWTPAAMQSSAEQLVQFIEARFPSWRQASSLSLDNGAPATSSGQPAGPTRLFASQSVDVENLGDIAAMMKLPEEQTLYKAQAVTVRQILRADKALWQSSPDSELLLLGDSFTNIFSLKEMNWGEAAGFAEQLSFQLQQPIDRIAQNDAGAFATRQTLSNELARGNDRLAGKKLVVWQFAIRELAVGDWKLLPMKLKEPAAPRGQTTPTPAVEGELVVSGTVRSASGMPKPGSVPYSEGVTAIHLVGVKAVEGEMTSNEIVVFLWGMRNNELTPAGRYKGGESITLNLTPWSEAEAEFGRFTRVELDDPDFVLISLPTYWGELVGRNEP